MLNRKQISTREKKSNINLDLPAQASKSNKVTLLESGKEVDIISFKERKKETSAIENDAK